MKTFVPRPRRSAPQRRGLSAAARRTTLALALGACFLSTHAASAVTNSYVGSGTATTPTSGNFSSGITPAIGTGSTTTSLGFGGTGGTTYTATNDIVGLMLNNMTFTSTATVPEVITGNAITFSGTSPTITQSGTGAFSIANLLTATGLTFGGTGTGAVTLNSTAAAGTSTLSGQTSINNPTLNIGDLAGDAPVISFGGGGASIGVFVGANGANSTLNVVNGTLTSTATQGLVLGATDTYNQTGGSFTTNGRVEFANGGGTSTVNVSGGNLTTTYSAGLETVRGTTTINLSGTGTITTPLLDMTTTQLSGGAAGSTFNLNGGTLATGQIIKGTNGATGTQTFNFNGGTLQASATSATFLTGLTNAFVKAGGALINTGAFNDTIAQNLLTDAVSTGGGLTKSGTGILTLSGADTYTGATAVNVGTLQLGSTGALGNTSGVTVATGATLDLDGNSPSVSTPLTLNGTGISSGGALINSSATAATYSGLVSLGTATTSIVSNSGDIILSSPGTISVANTGAADMLTLGGTDAGGSDVQSKLSDSGSGGFGLIVSKVGAGTWTLGGSGTSTLAKGTINDTAGTLNFGSATEAPTLTLSALPTGGTASVYQSGGNFNMNAGTLTATNAAGGGIGLYDNGGNINVSGGTVSMNAGQGLVLSGTQTYGQTGGAFSTNGYIEFANNGGSSTVNISGGSLTTTNATVNATNLAVRGTTTFTLSGTGTFTTPTLNMTTSQIGSGAATSTFNLNGGTLVAGSVIKGTGGSTGTQTFNFNGGSLQASASSTTFMTGLTTANVRNGGAVINTNGFSDTIGQALVHSTIGGDAATDGGLAKTGAGTLTLSGANTYNGATSVNTGTLAVTGSTAAGSAVTVASGATLTGTGTVGGSVADNGTINAGTVGTVGTLGTGVLTLNTGSTLGFDAGGGTSDLLNINGLLNASSGVTVAGNVLSPLTASSYELAGFTGLGSGTTLSDFTLTGAGLSGYHLALTSTMLDLIQNVTVSNGQYTLTAAPALGNVHQGDTTTITDTFKNTGTSPQDTLSYTGLTDSGTVGAVSPSFGGPVALGATTTGTATFTGTNTGTNTITPSATVTNTTASGTPTGTINSGSVNVFSGQETYQGPSGTYVTNNNTVQAQWSGGGAPGLDSNYLGQDTVTINGTGNGSGPGSGQTVTLDGANPNLAAVNLGNGATLAKGTGTGGLTLQSNSGTATVTATRAGNVLSAPVTLATNTTVTTTASTDALNIAGPVSGTGGLTKAGAGGLTLTSANNTYSGGTTVSGGTLNLDAAAADGGGGLTISGSGISAATGTGGTGGTVALDTTTTDGTGTGSALGAGGVTLSGGTLANANLTATSAAGATPQGNNIQNGGALTLTTGTTSVIDFGAGNMGAVFNFTGLTFTGSTDNTVLDVLNFRGNFNDGTNGGDGLDQLIFGNSKSLSAAQLADIVFVNPYDAQNGIQYGTNFTASQLSDGEVSPAPEPSQVGMMGLMAFGLGGLILRAKKRQARKTETAP